jgi:hypothetical protein
MSGPNGHAQKDHGPASGPPPAMLAPGFLQLPAERIKELVAALEVPFDQSQIDWRVTNTTKRAEAGAWPSCSICRPAGLYGVWQRFATKWAIWY